MTFDWSFIYRKKKYDATTIEQTELSRVLNFVDITALGGFSFLFVVIYE